MELEYGVLHGRRLQAVQRFLAQNGLEPPQIAPAFTVNLLEGDDLVASGSLDGNVLKYIAVMPGSQGEGLCAKVVSCLVQHAVQQGHAHLMLCTSPKRRTLFGGTGFYPVAETADMLLMENVRNGAEKFVSALPRPSRSGPVGAIVANCNPFTLGHRHLAETAASQCGFLYFFVVSEDRSFFPAAARLELARKNLEDISNIVVCPTGDYMVSAATFPTYFLKDQDRAAACSAELDLKIFADCFAKPLGISMRFMGEEPLCPVTDAYNAQMLRLLPHWGIRPVVIPRLNAAGVPISASQVRALLQRRDWKSLRPLVTDVTYHYLCEEYRNAES